MPATLGEKRRCERCGKDVIFLKHEKTGKLAPMEVEPRPDGRFAINWEDNSYRTVAGTSKDGTQFSQRRQGRDYHENHYTICPDAQFFRDRSKTSPGGQS